MAISRPVQGATQATQGRCARGTAETDDQPATTTHPTTAVCPWNPDTSVHTPSTARPQRAHNASTTNLPQTLPLGVARNEGHKILWFLLDSRLREA
jgi:hypothetical protein